MNKEIQREFGEQPIVELMATHEVKAKDLVEHSTEQLTFKMLSKACKGRFLTDKAKGKVLRALKTATGESFLMGELFNY
ncbi:MAG: hypothetical protein HQK83_13370 [Fibrobacteria bacterium]|nr:hypothetical protein [Fibrobacteria bacterium]